MRLVAASLRPSFNDLSKRVGWKITLVARRNTYLLRAGRPSLFVGQKLQQLLHFYQRDKSEAIGDEKMVKYKSDFLSPRFDFEQGGKIAAENAERVWIRNVFGVAAILRTNVTVVGPWE